MVGVDRGCTTSMVDAGVATDPPNTVERGVSLLVLPLNLIVLIVSYVDDPGDFARLCRTSRLLNYMTLPLLYNTVTLTSYDKIRYRNDEPEGWGNASPFSMGLDALITRPFASLVRSLTLRGQWRDSELEEHSRLGRVSDSSMMLNIAVRAAIDRTRDLQSFSWELNTKMLETVYLGLSQLPALTSLTIKFPSSRHPRPIIVVPPMPHLRYLKVTDIDPLCYPDDISLLLLKSRKLQALKMHWSPRMRNAQEPSVMLHDYFRKCIAADQPAPIRSISLQNLYAIIRDDLEKAIDPSTLEEISCLSDLGMDDQKYMSTFVDRSWPSPSPRDFVSIKCLRHDAVSQRVCDSIGRFRGIERLYFVNSSRDLNSPVNLSGRSTRSSSCTPRPSSMTEDAANYCASNNFVQTAAPSESNSPTASDFNFDLLANLRDSYINNVITYHSTSLRYLLLSSRWILPSSTIASLIHSCPQLEQLGFATDGAGTDKLAVLLPTLPKLVSFRLLIPTVASNRLPGHSEPLRAMPAASNVSRNSPLAGFGFDEFPPVRGPADIMDINDDIITDKLSVALASKNFMARLQVFSIGWKAWELKEIYTIPLSESSSGSQAATFADSNFTTAQGEPEPGRWHHPNKKRRETRRETGGDVSCGVPTTSTMHVGPETISGPNNTNNNNHHDNNGLNDSDNGHLTHITPTTSSATSTTAKTAAITAENVAYYPHHPQISPVFQPQPQPQSTPSLGKRARNDSSVPTTMTPAGVSVTGTSNPPQSQNDDSNRRTSRNGLETAATSNNFGVPNNASTATIIYDSNRLRRRRLKRVGWEVLKHWDIWAMDSQEL